LLLDESVSEIMGNPDASWWYERDGILHREKTVSFDAGRLRTGLEVIANQLGKRLDEDNPLLNAQLPDGSRLAAVIPPVVRPAPALAVECQTDTFKASISFDDLLKSALRWRPDRIILGEVRGIEARTLLDSFNTGHAGSLATIHANSAEKALHRFANLVMRNHAQTTFSDTEAEIGEAVDFVVHV